ncbi:MAG: hypothetical protein H0X01_00615 [Nitrospira sp.]|nr:hypothetical protein [Nitrospira sp.]
MEWLWNKLKGFKTLGFNLLVMLAAMTAWGASYDWSTVTNDHAAVITVAITLANIALRFMTSTPVLSGKD